MMINEQVKKMQNDPRFAILVEVDRLLTSKKNWAGMEWTYHPIHPHNYLPVSKKVREALDALAKEYGVEE